MEKSTEKNRRPHGCLGRIRYLCDDMERKLTQRLFMLVAALMICLPAAAEKQEDIYMFGVATNFKDSVAYITTIQRVDSAILRRGSGLLTGRSLYSTQLKRYAEA